MLDLQNPNNNESRPRPLTRSQVITVWVGLIGAAIGCSAWMLTMAAMGGDWMAFALTVALDILMVFVFARLSLGHPKWRFPLLAVFIILITGHCLGMYWWRYELWRGIGEISPAELVREKKIVTMTIAAMMSIVLAQFVVVYFLQVNSRKNRAKMKK